MADIQQLEDAIVSLSLLEASALVKKLEERLGVSAAAAVAAAVGGRRGGSGCGCSGRREDGVHRDPEGRGREQDCDHQGGSRGDGAGSEGSQGPGGRRAQAVEGECVEGRRGGDREEVRRTLLRSRSSSSERGVRAAGCHPGSHKLHLLAERGILFIGDIASALCVQTGECLRTI